MPIDVKCRRCLLSGGATVIFALASVIPMHAQQEVVNRDLAPMLDAGLPDAPVAAGGAQTAQTPQPSAHPSDNPDAVSPNGTQQTKRILGVMPNFRSVSPDIQLPKQTAKDKLVDAAHDSFDYSSFLLAAVQA